MAIARVDQHALRLGGRGPSRPVRRFNVYQMPRTDEPFVVFASIVRRLRLSEACECHKGRQPDP